MDFILENHIKSHLGRWCVKHINLCPVPPTYGLKWYSPMLVLSSFYLLLARTYLTNKNVILVLAKKHFYMEIALF